MSYSGFLDRIRAKNYAMTRGNPINANITISGPNTFQCVNPPPPPPPNPNPPPNLPPFSIIPSPCNCNQPLYPPPNHHNHQECSCIHNQEEDHICNNDCDCDCDCDHSENNHDDCCDDESMHPIPMPSPPPHPFPMQPYYPQPQQPQQPQVPIGSVIFFYGTQIPFGWLICNGNLISYHKYPELIQTMGNNVLPNIKPIYPGGYYIIKSI